MPGLSDLGKLPPACSPRPEVSELAEPARAPAWAFLPWLRFPEGLGGAGAGALGEEGCSGAVVVDWDGAWVRADVWVLLPDGAPASSFLNRSA